MTPAERPHAQPTLEKGATVVINHNDNNQPACGGYRLVDENVLSFLWFQAAGITLH